MEVSRSQSSMKTWVMLFNKIVAPCHKLEVPCYKMLAKLNGVPLCRWGKGLTDLMFSWVKQ